MRDWRWGGARYGGCDEGAGRSRGAAAPVVAAAVGLSISALANDGEDATAAEPEPVPAISTAEPARSQAPEPRGLGVRGFGPRGPGRIALIPADGLDPGWRLAESARVWNDRTGCALFTFDTDGVETAYAVVEDDELILDGETIWGQYQGSRSTIVLNPDPGHKGVHQRATMHELGHAAGLLDHSDDPRDVMNVIEGNQTVVPSPDEIDHVRRLHPDWCG